MKVRVVKFRLMRSEQRPFKRTWAKEHKAYHYDMRQEAIEFIEQWKHKHDNSQLY